MSYVKVYAGICGFITEIRAERMDETNVKLEIKSDCPVIAKAAEKIKVINGVRETGKGLANSEVVRVLAGCGMHTACPVPCGIMKAIEVALDLALPSDVKIEVKNQ